MTKTETATYKVLELDLDKLRLDGGTQPRAELDAEWVAHLREIAEHENEPGAPHLPELVAFHDGSSYWLAEGFHRYFAKKKAGHKKAATIVHTGTLQDAILFAAGTNAAHGKPRTHADIRHAVRMLLANAEWRKWSDREIARRVNISKSAIVGDERRKMHQEEERQRQAEKEAQRKKREEEEAKNKPKPRAQQSAAQNSNCYRGNSDKPAPASSTASNGATGSSDVRTYRTKHGTTATMNTANIDGVRVKLIEVETEPEQLENLDKQIPRSRRKYALQCVRRGISEDQAVEDFRKEYRSILVKA